MDNGKLTYKSDAGTLEMVISDFTDIDKAFKVIKTMEENRLKDLIEKQKKMSSADN